jgi:hypothetical protein
MLGLLSRDTGAQMALCSVLELGEMAQLASTCTHWRQWIGAMPPSVSPPALRLTAHSTLLLQRGSWASRWPRSLVIYKPVHRRSSAGGVIAAMLLSIPGTFVRLTSLHLVYDDELRMDELTACLHELRGRLEKFDILNWTHFEGDRTDEIAALLQQLGQMRRLHTLRVQLLFVMLGEHRGGALDFSPLAQMPQLTDLSFGLDHTYETTTAQLTSIACCRQLSTLELGVSLRWTPAQLDAFARARPADAVPMAHVDMRLQAITSPLWPHLKQFAGLISLQPSSWQLTPAEWAELPRSFPRLQCLTVRYPFDFQRLESSGPDPPADIWIGAVSSCGAHLTDLSIYCMLLTTAQLRRLCDSLPSLRTLRLLIVTLEDVATVGTLSSLRALTTLFFDCFLAEPNESWDVPWWALLPVLPQLRELVLRASSTGGANLEERARQRRALLVRMPRLTHVRFLDES